MHRCTPLQNNPPCRFPLAGVPPGAMAMGPIRLRACPAGRIHAAHSALLRGTHRVLPFVARRVLSSASQPDPSEQVATAIGSLPPFADAALRGVGQVVFCNSPGSGALILAGLGVADPFLASMATLGVTTSTAAAMMGGLDRAAINSGLYGYNGALVGCAFSVFLGTSLPVTLAATTAGAAATPFVGRAIAPLCASVPQFTLAFNAVALSTLAVVCPFKAASVAPETPIEVVVGTAADTIPPATVVTGVAELMMSPLTGISQIFVVESPLSGVCSWEVMLVRGLRRVEFTSHEQCTSVSRHLVHPCHPLLVSVLGLRDRASCLSLLISIRALTFHMFGRCIAPWCYRLLLAQLRFRHICGIQRWLGHWCCS